MRNERCAAERHAVDLAAPTVAPTKVRVGQTVRVEIEGIGSIENPVIAQPPGKKW